MILYGRVYDSYKEEEELEGCTVTSISSNPYKLKGDVYECVCSDFAETQYKDLEELHKHWKPYNAKELIAYGQLINGTFYAEDCNDSSIKNEDLGLYHSGQGPMVFAFCNYVKGNLVSITYE